MFQNPERREGALTSFSARNLVRSARLKKKMAIYHLTAKTVSRGTSSAKARSEYIDREGKYKKDHEEVLYKASGNMPSWASESRKYWEAADTYERGNGRLFKQLEFALPKELKPEEQKEVVQAYVSQLTTTKDGKLPYSYAIHKGHDKDNPHCHLMISERPLDGHNRSPETWFKRANSKASELGGSKKTTELMPKEWLQSVRESWSKEANKALEKSGHETQIDHRTLEAQGIDRTPTRHRGVALNAMLESGKITKEEIAKDLLEPINTKGLEVELAEAQRLKLIITSCIKSFRQDFDEDKERQLADERTRQVKIEQERQQALEKQARVEAQRQKELDQERQRKRSQNIGIER